MKSRNFDCCTWTFVLRTCLCVLKRIGEIKLETLSFSFLLTDLFVNFRWFEKYYKFFVEGRMNEPFAIEIALGREKQTDWLSFLSHLLDRRRWSRETNQRERRLTRRSRARVKSDWSASAKIAVISQKADLADQRRRVTRSRRVASMRKTIRNSHLTAWGLAGSRQLAYSWPRNLGTMQFQRREETRINKTIGLNRAPVSGTAIERQHNSPPLSGDTSPLIKLPSYCQSCRCFK